MNCTCQVFSHKEPLVLHHLLRQWQSRNFCQAWDSYASALRCEKCSQVSRLLKEVAILRVAHRKNFSYVLHIHKEMASDAGLSQEEISAIEKWTENKTLFSPRLQHVLQLTDDLLDDKFVEQTMLPPAHYLELVCVIAFYLNVGCVTKALHLEPKSQMVHSRL